jgi:hypothetical protein
MHPFLSGLALVVGLLVQDTTVVMVRHAEKASATDPDTPISEAGRKRAAALVPQLAALKPTVLYTSERIRTQQTLAPTATHLGLQPRIHSSDAPEALAAEILKDHRGRTVAVAWHHGPHEAFARALGVVGPLPVWTSSTFDRIWVIRVPPKGPARFEERLQNPVP